MTDEQYEAMRDAQAGVCLICDRPETQIDARSGNTRPLAVDHDHDTNLVRGLLCHACNVGLGYFQDSPERMERAAGYIRDHLARVEAFQRQHDVDLSTHQSRVAAAARFTPPTPEPKASGRRQSPREGETPSLTPKQQKLQALCQQHHYAWCPTHQAPLVHGPHSCYRQHQAA